jgi:hypothetical protein
MYIMRSQLLGKRPLRRIGREEREWFLIRDTWNDGQENGPSQGHDIVLIL